MAKCFISYRHTQPDERVAVSLQQYLAKHGHRVFIDRLILPGMKWGDKIEKRIKEAKFFIVLLSIESITSDMVREEVRIAYELARLPKAKLKILPVRVAFQGALPYPLGAYLNQWHYASWQKGVASETLGAQILAAMKKNGTLPHEGKAPSAVASAAEIKALYEVTEAIGAPLSAADPIFFRQVASETGPVHLKSPFYIRRETDRQVFNGLRMLGQTVVIRGSRQMGKSSLLARAEAFVKQRGEKTVYFDFQLIETEQFQSLKDLVSCLAWKLCRTLRTSLTPDGSWDNKLPHLENLTNFMETGVLSGASSPVLVLFDEVDYVFKYPYYGDFFRALRSWQHRQKIYKLWENLKIAIAHSTETSLWMPEPYESPFNVGLKVRLEDFNLGQLRQINKKFPSPLENDKLQELIRLVGGHPFLIRQSLYGLSILNLSLSKLESEALEGKGPLGDHLSHVLWLLLRNKPLKAGFRQILHGGKCSDKIMLHRLEAAGLLKNVSDDSAEIRCELYRKYFEKHL